MFKRVVAVSLVRAAAPLSVRPAAPVHKPLSMRVLAPVVNMSQMRLYSGDHHQLTYDEVKERVLTVVKAFDKVDSAKVTAESNFQKDLGIDSLDAVELVMALEDEFVIEIPDVEAEKIQSCADAIQYISTHPHAK
jgi:NADH dehydrogenase (ubiquinone) 1 alpha/beta subcomplex 1